MASLFRDRTIGHSRRDSFSSTASAAAAAIISSASSRFSGIATTAASALSPLPSPFDNLTPTLTAADLRETAYEIFVAACRTSTGKALTYITAPVDGSQSPSQSLNSNNSSSSASLQRSLTSTAASKMKKALGLRSTSNSTSRRADGSPGSGGKPKKPMTVGELMRVQMRVSETVDSRIRRGLLRISASQVGRRIESTVLPLELLQQFKSSDFTDQAEYERWQRRNLKILEAGLLLHPLVPLDKSNASSTLRQIIQAALERPMETGRNNESMQVLRKSVMALATRSSGGSTLDSSHWADGFPLNLRLYEILLEAIFDVSDETSIIEEVDELMELIKKTWGILGLNQTLHNVCFTWVLFNRFVATGQGVNELLDAANGQLAEVAKDAKQTKDPEYSKILSSTLTAILGWAEKRLLAYHETFDAGNIESMQIIVSIGVSAAKILVEDISNEYRRRRKGEVDVARSRIDTYIRSSLRTAFAQRMEKADSNRRASRNQLNPLPVLVILAKDVGELATKEKEVFSPILKRWHPFAAGLAVATLHVCYGNELKQFVSGITELTPDAVQVLRAADKLEKDLVQIAVEDSVDSDDGGKAIIREMPPFEAEGTIANMVRDWIKLRTDRLKEWVDRCLQQEGWSPPANEEGYALSVIELLRIMDETLDAFFQLPIPMHPSLLPDLMAGIDRCLEYYVTKTKSGCGSRSTYIPTMPALTRCTTGTKLSVWKKRDKPIIAQRRNSQVATMNGDSSSFGMPQLLVRINTLQKIRTELEVLEKRIITLLRNSESAHVDDISNISGKKFEITPTACIETIQQISEALVYKVVFNDLGHVLWDGLYVGDPSSSRIEPFLQEVERILTIISNTVNGRVCNWIVADIMKASFDAFLFVLLAGGPSRAFTRHDSKILEEDFDSLKDLFWANGDGLPIDVINKYSTTVRDVLSLYNTDTESLVESFRRLTVEAYGSSAKSRLPLPPTSGQWKPTEPNTLLRVICHRNDETATKFLKKTYNLPKKL
ncbi:unnamed protein product [Cuscuta epithymum]|uniref:MHD1 domain-containing protein n=1 Tax=Cuscuta epithymum TaxID=186058 RepID=A0AAV0C2T6_9ASTE|nr:unnamed protein product [Cuscuta epithymum]